MKKNMEKHDEVSDASECVAAALVRRKGTRTVVGEWAGKERGEVKEVWWVG